MTQSQDEIQKIDWFKLAEFIGVNSELVPMWNNEDKRWALRQAMDIISPTKSPLKNKSQKTKANFWEWH